jgi:nucleoside-diphosphate-sugar epimerase
MYLRAFSITVTGMPEVAVIGAAGFVGQRLCVQLAEDGIGVTGVVRRSSGFLLDRIGVPWIPTDATDQRAFDVVVNLAYPTSGSVYDYPKQNRELLSLIKQLVSPGGLVIQVSTQAVFGMALEYPQSARPLPMRRDFIYVESKIELENLLVEQLSDTRLDVVRLGNVWGPGSAAWTGALAQRLQFGVPTAVHGRDGYSNITDVANLVSYISFLVRRERNSEATQFHHLAELGELRWSHWIKRIGEQLGVVPVYGELPGYSGSPQNELNGILRAAPRRVARELKDARFSGSTVRSLMRALPTGASRPLKRRWAKGGSAGTGQGAEDQLLTVLCCDRRLSSVLDRGWSPPVDAEASWLAVSSWLDKVGYT